MSKDRLQEVRDEIKVGVRTSPTYTIEDCVKDWLASLERDPHTMETITGQAQKWIYPRIGPKKLRRFKVDDADKFFREIAPFLSQRLLVMIKSTLRRSIRRAQARDLIGRNVIDLIDLPPGRPGRSSRAMTEEEAGAVLKAARGRVDRYTRVVKASNGRYGATHAATEGGTLACGTRPHPKAAITEVGSDLQAATCRSCRTQLGLERRGRQPAPGRPLRHGHHPRPAPGRAPQAHLGPGRPQPGRGPCLAQRQQVRRHQDASVQALAGPSQTRHHRAEGSPRHASP